MHKKFMKKPDKKSKNLSIRTGASPGTFRTVSGTARMVPAEDLSILIGSQLECTSIVDIFKRKCSTNLMFYFSS